MSAIPWCERQFLAAVRISIVVTDRRRAARWIDATPCARDPDGGSTGRRDGHRPIRLHADPAADDRTGRDLAAHRGQPGHRELRRISGGCPDGYRLATACQIDDRVPGVPDRPHRQSRRNAVVHQYNRVDSAARRGRADQRPGVRDRGQRDAGTPPWPSCASCRLGVRRYRRRHRAFSGARAGHRRLEGGLVGVGGGVRGAGDRRLVDAARSRNGDGGR